tara:strand:+ start:349 stop:744 length:396 start_codon:yes stop_codon:yes gene_type:complete
MVKKSRLAADIIYEAYQEGLRQAALDAYTRKKKRDLRAIQAVTRSLRAPQTSAMMAKYAQLAARQLAEKELSQPRPKHKVLRVAPLTSRQGVTLAQWLAGTRGEPRWRVRAMGTGKCGEFKATQLVLDNEA